jgi:hypothetical protein
MRSAATTLMATLLPAAILAAAMLLASPVSYGQAASLPLEAFGSLPTLEDVLISPDGSRLAFVRTEGEDRFVVAKQIAAGQTLGAVKVGNTKLRNLIWIDNDTLLITASYTSAPPVGYTGPISEWFRPVILELKGGKTLAIDLSVSGERVFNVLSGRPVSRTVAGKTVLFVPGMA